MASLNSQIFTFTLTIFTLPCFGVRWRHQLDQPRRSFYSYDPNEVSHIYGVPEFPSHLPEAEPIMPGQTLLKPALGMLKSAIKFPHVDLEDGSGVYGNTENLGLRYDGTNERVLYTGFRRSPADYLMVVPEKNTRYKSKPRFKLVSTVLDLEKKNSIEKILRRLRQLNFARNTKIVILSALDGNFPHERPKSSYLTDVKPDDHRQKMVYRYRPVKPIRDNPFLRSEIWKPSQKFSNFKTFEQDRKIIKDRGDHLSLRDKEKSSSEEGREESDTEKKKLISLLNMKENFSHVKYSEHAPDYATLIPLKVQKNLRDWWFFNQDDFGPLTGN